MPFQGVIPAASFPAGRCPEPSIRIFNPQYPAVQPPRKRGSGCQAPSLWEGWVGLLFVYRIIYPHTLCRRIAYPPERKGNTACARACSLSKQSGERRANNQSAQGSALGICLYVSVAPQGQKNEKQLPLPTAFCVSSYSFALSGRYPCCILSRRALPWADVSMPLWGVSCPQFPRPAPFPREEAVLCHSINGLKGQQSVSPRHRLGVR